MTPRNPQSLLWAIATIVPPLLVACSGDGTVAAGSAAGGDTPVGGSSASAGGSSNGGSSAPIGGVTSVATGGASTNGTGQGGTSTWTGGASTNGTGQGGTSAWTGGAAALGGNVGTGGAAALGGNVGTGGVAAFGGNTPAGGATTGGTAATRGGAKSAGGSTSTGGVAAARGGATTGGTAAGGVAASAGASFWKSVTYSSTGLPDVPSGNHNAGRDCLTCHTGTSQAPRWYFAGTVYKAGGTSPAPNVQIGVNDGTNLYTAYSGTNGNFYLRTTATVNWASAQVRIRNANGEKLMIGATPAAACNSCHTGTGTPRITAP